MSNTENKNFENAEGTTMETSTTLATTNENSLAPTIEQLTWEVKFYLNQMGQNAIEVGKRLIQAKKMLPHGEFGNWLEKNFSLKVRMAQKFIAIAERFGISQDSQNASTSTHLNQSQMMELLALPAGDEEKFIEEKAAEGNPVENMTVKNLRKEVKKWKAEAETAQNKLAGLAAENTNMELAMDNAIKEAQLWKDKADEHASQIFTLQYQNSKLDNDFQIVVAQAGEAAQQVQELQQELEQLKNQPPTEVVPADYEENKKAVTELQNQIMDLQAKLSNQTVEIVPPADYEATKQELKKLQDTLAETKEKLRQDLATVKNIEQLFNATRFLLNQLNLLDAVKLYQNSHDDFSQRLAELFALHQQLTNCSENDQ